MENPGEQLQISNSDDFSVTLDVNSVVESWLTRTTNSSLKRSNDIRNDKSKAVFDFFDFCGKSAEQVLPSDVEEWRWSLKTQRLADGTIYNRISALAQFFEYLRNEVGMMKLIPINPAKVSLPKASKPFQSESVKALSREELGKLLEVVCGHALGKQPVHLRDHALLQFYVSTGRRRAEIISLRGNSIEIKTGRFFIKAKVKGGFFLNFELNDKTTKNALFDIKTTQIYVQRLAVKKDKHSKSIRDALKK